ncbi:MAG: zinc ribbon domain-containing protein [Tissierellia bacterium]|nr:zinc ribbon domain-containing protein [Tissierellia bacterium]
MFCEHCGASLDKKQKFCNQCGEKTRYSKKQGPMEEDVIYEIIPAEERIQQKEPQKKGNFLGDQDSFEEEFSMDENIPGDSTEDQRDPFLNRTRYPSPGIYKEDYSVGTRPFIIAGIALFFPFIALAFLSILTIGNINSGSLMEEILDFIQRILDQL